MQLRALVPELVVSDLETSLRFYVTVLGFVVEYRRANPPFAYLELEGSQIMLEERQEDSWVVGELARPFGRGMNLQIACADVDQIRGRVRHAGVAVFHELEVARYTAGDSVIVQSQFIVADPDGYLLRFCQVLGRQGAGFPRDQEFS